MDSDYRLPRDSEGLDTMFDFGVDTQRGVGVHVKEPTSSTSDWRIGPWAVEVDPRLPILKMFDDFADSESCGLERSGRL